MSWSEFSAIMDETVDDALGDVISYAAGGVAFVDIKGFIIAEEPVVGHEAIDDILSRPRIKIRTSLIGKPTLADRVRCPARLGAETYRPVGKTAREQGRYWLADLEKVR